MSKLNGHSKNDELRTPAYIYDWLNRRFRFTCDAAATIENTKCASFFVGPCVRDQMGPTTTLICECALCSSWKGQRVFLNPPYSRPLFGQFIESSIEERDNAEIIVMLVKWDTSTENARLLRQYAHIEELRRVQYDDENGNPLPAATFASAIAILRPSEPRR
jgi:hypothetical protein